MITIVSGLLIAALGISTNCASISTVKELAVALAGRQAEKQSFDLEACVTHIRPIPLESGFNELSIAISNGANAVVSARFRTLESPPRAGDRIRCKGYVATHNRHTQAYLTEPASVISHGIRPKPLDLSIQDLLKGNHEYSFVRIRGRVYGARPSETNQRYLLLSIVDANSLVEASSYITEEESRRCQRLIGTEVCIEGIYSTSDGVRHHIGGNIKLANFSSIKVIRTAEDADADAPALSELDNCRADEIPLFVRHYAIGRVTAIMDNQVLMTTPNGDYVYAELLCGQVPDCGSCIRATGFPDTDLVNIRLAKASWKPEACTVPPEPQTTAVTASQLNFNKIGYGIHALHGKRITVTGKVVAQVDFADQPNMIHIICDGQPLQVYFRFGSEVKIEEGTEIEVSGTCMIDSDRWHRLETAPKIRGFVIVTRSSDDIRILARPPWWNPSRLLVVVCALLLAIVGIGVWNRMLSRLAERRGRELMKAQLTSVKSQMKVLERTRLAVELHDSIAQNLTGVSMELTTADLLSDGAPADMRNHLGTAMQTLKSCREELRNCIWDLRSNALEEANLEKAILCSLNLIANRARIVIRFPVSRRHVSDNVAHAVLRIIRELASNGINHGKATVIRIAGKVDNGKIMFSVEDNGTGFDPENHPGTQEGHFGIQGIRERLCLLKGSMAFSSTNGNGCKVRVEIPLEDDDAGVPT